MKFFNRPNEFESIEQHQRELRALAPPVVRDTMPLPDETTGESTNYWNQRVSTARTLGIISSASVILVAARYDGLI